MHHENTNRAPRVLTCLLLAVAAPACVDLEGEPEDGLSTESFELALQNEGHIYMPWSFANYTAGVDAGSSCGGAIRDHITTYSSQGQATECSAHWLTDIDTDCRIHVTYSLPQFRVDTCNWYVYVQ
jgi:hypothetical protein